MYRLPPGPDLLRRILTVLPGLALSPRALGLLALHLADEDELARGWIDQLPYHTRILGECPGCRRRSLEVTTAGPAAARTVVRVQDCRRIPDCRCPGGEEDVRHTWLRADVLSLAGGARKACAPGRRIELRTT